MVDKETAPLLLNVDADEVPTQFGKLLKLVELPANSFEGIFEYVAELFFDRVRGLIDNIVLSDFATTVSTTDVGEICLRVKITGLVEHLTSTVRVYGPHGLHEYILSTVGEIREQAISCCQGITGNHAPSVVKNSGINSSSVDYDVLINL